jgi:Domain of unknown function (DUF222)/HNH endonuclease
VPVFAISNVVPLTDKRHSHNQRSEALGDKITELCGYLNAGTYRLLEMIRQFDREELWQLDGICSCAHWLNWKCGIGMNAAREKVRVANALGKLPKISASYAKGEISYSKVRAMTRVATPDNEDALLMIAHHGTAYHVEELVRKYRRARKLQDLEEANRQHDERSLQVFYEADGAISLHLRLPAEKGALVIKAIELATQQADADGNGAAASIATESGPTESEPTESGQPRESFACRQADAIADMAESYLANGPTASSSADRYQVVLHVAAETLSNSEGDISHLEDGPRVSAETSRRVCCDAGISVLREGADGTLLNIGRKSRLIPPAMRRALKARDENCRFPGCTHKYYIDGHHIRHWSDGGETSLDNLVRLCRHHHRLVHEGGFSCTRNAQGKLEFRNPDGVLIAPAGRLPTLPADFDLGERLRNRYEDLYIDANTCVSQFDDNRIDWDLAVGYFFQ